MDTERPLKLTGYFSLIIGIINIGTWSFLIISQNVGDISGELIKYLFHWVSELTTALLLIVAGLKILRNKSCSINMMFLSLGFLLMAIGGAFVYYLSNFDIVFFVFSALITGATIILLILNFKSLKDFVFLALGMSIYGLINILGEGFHQENIFLISMSFPSLIFLVLLVISLYNKDIVFRKLPK